MALKRLFVLFISMFTLPLLLNAEPRLLNHPVDVSKDFEDAGNTFFLAEKLSNFDPEKGEGLIEWARYKLEPRLSFNNINMNYKKAEGAEFPAEYAVDPQLPFSISFVTPKTVRLRIATTQEPRIDEPSLMLVNEPVKDTSWKVTAKESEFTYSGEYASAVVRTNPWGVEFRDKTGKLLTKSIVRAEEKSLTTYVPFSFVRKVSDYQRETAAVFSIAPDEKFFGCGESFTGLDKRGQKLILWTNDALGAQNSGMYKPIPFFMSSRGYGVFVNTTAPLTVDFGNTFDSANAIYSGDDYIDIFFFFGSPKEILSEYTALTGRSPLPPLWSFGLWMSRITYFSEDEVREVAGKLRDNKIPSDVIHLDTGWFETDWRCDYKFSKSRFKDPAKMINDLKNDGFRVSLWQLPYFNPNNTLFREIVDKDYAIRNNNGDLPTEDAILDFSNPETVEYYQNLIADLMKMGVGAIKVDFGESAPLKGIYASGKSGFFEHNLYPLRYNKAVSEITKKTTGESIIWARSAWAGSQRYPIHWGGDSENTDAAMAASLRGGLSLGLCGFSFWSHDIGGFVGKSPEELYRRWMPFGMLTSHSRCHGAPPKEPWHYSAGFMDDFRRADEMKYLLMPYVYAQAAYCSENGFPMIRSMFFEYPDDTISWMIEDQYFFGEDILVAPLFNAGAKGRNVYLPPGTWIDYQDGKVYEGGKYMEISAGIIPVVTLVRDGAAIPHIKLAQSTEQMDFSEIELIIYSKKSEKASARICLPSDNILRTVELAKSGDSFKITNDPFKGKIKWKLTLKKP